jgi:Cys-tRNA(Pro)/Cys-tRNA(Cys) deacylase
LQEYEVDPDDLRAESVAAKIGLPAEQVFRTLVTRGDRNGVCLAVIPGDTELDLKALAWLTGDRKVELAALKEAQPLAGYFRGAVTALACKEGYPVHIDETATPFDRIKVSAGMRGLQILPNPEDYIRLVNATTGEIEYDGSQSEGQGHAGRRMDFFQKTSHKNNLLSKKPPTPTSGRPKIKQQPIAAPAFRCLPCRVNGMPIRRDSLPFAADNPMARFHENDKPGMPVFTTPP